MRIMKKALAIVLALSVVMAFSIVSFADVAGTDGSIKVENATENATYTAYKVFDATYAKDANGKVIVNAAGEKQVSYTYTDRGTTSKPDAFLAALKNGYTVTEGDTTVTKKSPFILTQTGTTGVYNVALDPQYSGNDTDGYEKATGEEIGAWLAGQEANLTAIATTSVSDNTAEFKNLTYGYYLIDSTVVGNPHAVTVDTTTPDVIVKDKNQGPTWDEPDDPNNPKPPYDPTNPATKNGKMIITSAGAVHDNEAMVGDTVKFEIAVNATAFDKEGLVTYYYIKDTLADGFTDAKNIAVKVYPTYKDTDGTYKYKDAETLVKGTGYTDIDPNNPQGFELRIPFGEKYGSNAKIVVSYEAVLQSNAVIGDAGNANIADFTWDVDEDYDPETPSTDEDYYDPENIPNDPSDDDKYPDPSGTYDDKGTDDPDDDVTTDPTFPEDNEKSTYTSTFAYGFTKVDGDENALAGATFKLDVPVIGSNGVYTYIPAAAVPAKLDQRTDAEKAKLVELGLAEDVTIYPAGTALPTTAEGKFVVKGVDTGDYTVTEVEPPAGYKIKEGGFTFHIAAKDNGSTTTPIYEYDADNCKVGGETAGNDSIVTFLNVQALTGNIVNLPGSELPSTGGIGTTIFYVLGGILVLGALVLLITRRRMNAE